ncbi:MAG: thioredoxin family protein [Inhella sp.]
MTPIEIYCLCAAWCGICRDYQLQLQDWARSQPHWRVHWVDVEDEAERLGELDIETFPTLLIAVDGQARFLGPVLPNAAALHTLAERAAQWAPGDAAMQALLARLSTPSPDVRLIG